MSLAPTNRRRTALAIAVSGVLWAASGAAAAQQQDANSSPPQQRPNEVVRIQQPMQRVIQQPMLRVITDSPVRVDPVGFDRPMRDNRDDSLSDSVRRVERSTRGKVLSAERMQSDGRDIHRIKVLDNNGRVRVIMDDPSRPTRDDND